MKIYLTCAQILLLLAFFVNVPPSLSYADGFPFDYDLSSADLAGNLQEHARPIRYEEMIGNSRMVFVTLSRETPSAFGELERIMPQLKELGFTHVVTTAFSAGLQSTHVVPWSDGDTSKRDDLIRQFDDQSIYWRGLGATYVSVLGLAQSDDVNMDIAAIGVTAAEETEIDETFLDDGTIDVGTFQGGLYVVNDIEGSPTLNPQKFLTERPHGRTVVDEKAMRDAPSSPQAMKVKFIAARLDAILSEDPSNRVLVLGHTVQAHWYANESLNKTLTEIPPDEEPPVVIRFSTQEQIKSSRPTGIGERVAQAVFNLQRPNWSFAVPIINTEHSVRPADWIVHLGKTSQPN